jgi:RNA polymerase sigma-70 factor, ECF subfamily
MMPSVPPSTDAESFERLYRAHREQVFATCFRLCGDRVTAGEWMQDVFVRIWEQWGALEDPDHAGGWVHRVTLNTVFNVKRANRRRLARVALADDFASPPPEPSTGGASLFATPTPMRRIALDRAMEAISGRAREVFVLHDVEGLPTDDIAHLLRITPSTVRVQLSRARAQLREALSS